MFEVQKLHESNVLEKYFTQNISIFDHTKSQLAFTIALLQMSKTISLIHEFLNKIAFN